MDGCLHLSLSLNFNLFTTTSWFVRRNSHRTTILLLEKNVNRRIIEPGRI